MTKINSTIYREMKSYCYGIVLKEQNLQLDEKCSHYRWGKIPDGIDTNGLGDYLILCGDQHTGYQKLIEMLRNEPLLDYLDNDNLDKQLWYLICELTIDYKKYRNNKNELNQKIDQFLSSIIRPVEDYEVLIPILDLNISKEYKIGNGIILKKVDKEFFSSYCFKEILDAEYEKIKDLSFLIIQEKGNNQDMIIDNARKDADYAIGIIRISLIRNINLHDEHVLFKKGQIIYFRKKNANDFGRIKKRDYCSYGLKIKDDDNYIDEFLLYTKDILEKKLSKEFQKLFSRTFAWISKGIEEEDVDMKIINLSTALETILSDKSEGLKGAQLSARMLILFIMMKKRFSNPIRLLKIYEIRSDIIHGTDLGISNRHEYITILRITIDTLLNSIELIKTRKIKNHKEFIYTIEHSPEKEIALKFLEEQGDEMSADIKKFIEEMK